MIALTLHGLLFILFSLLFFPSSRVSAHSVRVRYPALITTQRTTDHTESIFCIFFLFCSFWGDSFIRHCWQILWPVKTNSKDNNRPERHKKGGINIKIEYCPPLKNKKYETTTAGGGSVILTFERGPSSFGHRGTTGRYVCPAFYYFILTITPLFSYNIRVNLGAMVSSPFLSQSRIGDNISQAEWLGNPHFHAQKEKKNLPVSSVLARFSIDDGPAVIGVNFPMLFFPSFFFYRDTDV